MTYAQTIDAYLGTGLLAHRPSNPNVAPRVCAFYYATDVGMVYAWDGSVWHTVMVTAAGPALIKSETWDAEAAPTTPVDWTVDAPLITATSNAPASPPNSLIYPAASANDALVPVATWTTQDTNNGNVQVSATLRWANATGATGQQDLGVFARANGVLSAATFGSAQYYSASINLHAASGLTLTRGNTVTLAGPIGATAFADGIDYRLTLICNGSTISCRCHRLSDGYYLNSTGLWIPDPSGSTLALSVTDTVIAGAGYAGLWYYVQNSSGGDIGADDWLLEAI